MDPKIALLLFTLSAIVLSVSASPGKGPIESEIAVCIQNNNLFFRDFLSEVAGGGIGNDLGGQVRLYPRNGDILSHCCQMGIFYSILRKITFFQNFFINIKGQKRPKNVIFALFYVLSEIFMLFSRPEDLATLFFLTYRVLQVNCNKIQLHPEPNMVHLELT